MTCSFTAKGFSVSASELRAATEGVRPLRPVFFWDFDHAPTIEIDAFARSYLTEYDIYESSPGRYHLVGRADTWDRVQELIMKAAKWFPAERYIMSCRRQRLRISPKSIFIQNPTDSIPKRIEVAPEPRLLRCRCKWQHIERRVGVIEPYTTPFLPTESQRAEWGI